MAISNLTSPISWQPFIWYAKSFDDSLLTEFEDDKTENEFSDIDRVNLQEFGLMGRGAKLWFSTNDGILNIQDKRLEFYLEDEEQKLIKLSGRNEFYNDIIQFKQFAQVLTTNTKEGFGPLTIDAFHLGYKHSFEIEGKGKIHFAIILRMPMGHPMKIGFKITPSFDFKGKLFMRINGQPDSNPSDIDTKGDVSVTLEKDFF